MANKCKDCALLFGEEEALVCSGCGGLVHLKCLTVGGLSVQNLKTIKKFSQFKWFCEFCDSAFKDICSRFNRLADCFEKTDKYNKEYKNDIEKINEKIANLEKIMNERENKIVDEFKKVVSENEKQSFSGVLKNALNRPKPVVIVKAKNSEIKRNQVKDVIKNNIDPEKFPINGLRNAYNESVLIECDNPETATQIHDEINEKLGENFEVQIPDIKNPRLKIVNIYDDQKMSHDAFITAIKNQNSDIIKENDYMKVIKVIESNRNTNVKTLIIETNPDTYKKIIEAKKLKLKWSLCAVYEAIQVTRCFKCAGYGHRSDICNNNEACPKCAGRHSIKDCVNNIVKCINCINANSKFNSKLDIKHAAWDVNCNIYKRKLEIKRKSINYT